LQIGLLRHEKPKSWAPKWKSRGTIYGLQTPPEKLPGRHLRSFPRRAIHAGLAPRGGAGSARPQGRHRANPNLAPFWPPPYRQSVRDGDMPWFAPGPYFRTHGVRPSEKTAFAPSPGLPPQGRSSLHSPPPRRGGLRTPVRKVLA
jgi:hypothetical protein